MKLFLCKDEDDSWYFSLIPFEELDLNDNTVSCPSMDNELDYIWEDLNKKS